MFGFCFFQDLQAFISRMYEGRRVDVRPFGYAFDFADIGAAGSATATQKIIGNADFICCSMSFAAGDLFEDLAKSTIQIEDSGSQEKFFNQAVPITQVCSGVVGSEFYRGLAVPRRISGNSTVLVTVTADAALSTPQLYMDGVHVFVYGD